MKFKIMLFLMTILHTQGHIFFYTGYYKVSVGRK